MMMYPANVKKPTIPTTPSTIAPAYQSALSDFDEGRMLLPLLLPMVLGSTQTEYWATFPVGQLALQYEGGEVTTSEEQVRQLTAEFATVHLPQVP